MKVSISIEVSFFLFFFFFFFLFLIIIMWSEGMGHRWSCLCLVGRPFSSAAKGSSCRDRVGLSSRQTKRSGNGFPPPRSIQNVFSFLKTFRVGGSDGGSSGHRWSRYGVMIDGYAVGGAGKMGEEDRGGEEDRHGTMVGWE